MVSTILIPHIFTAAVKRPWERFLKKITAGSRIYIADKLPHYLIKSAARFGKDVSGAAAQITDDLH